MRAQPGCQISGGTMIKSRYAFRNEPKRVTDWPSRILNRLTQFVACRVVYPSPNPYAGSGEGLLHPRLADDRLNVTPTCTRASSAAATEQFDLQRRHGLPAGRVCPQTADTLIPSASLQGAEAYSLRFPFGGSRRVVVVAVNWRSLTVKWLGDVPTTVWDFL